MSDWNPESKTRMEQLFARNLFKNLGRDVEPVDWRAIYIEESGARVAEPAMATAPGTGINSWF